MALSVVDSGILQDGLAGCKGQGGHCPDWHTLEFYPPVCIILYINPKEVATIVRTKEHTVLFNLLHNTLWVAVHQVGESVASFVTLRGHECKVKHDTIVLTFTV